MGIMHRKMNGLGNRSWPDQMFTLAGPYTLFIECKLPGEEPSPLQWDKIQELRGLGYAVAVCDTKEDGWLCLEICHRWSSRSEESREGITCFDYLGDQDKKRAERCFTHAQGVYDKNASKPSRGLKAVGSKSFPKAGSSIHAQEPRSVRVGRPWSR
jgi:hypothetical protein